MNGIQSRGAFMTYAQRYSLLAVLGWTADTDTDGADGGRVRDDTPPREHRRDRASEDDGNGDGDPF